MAADSLVAAAKEMGVDLQVETQGSSGAKPLDPAIIAAADAVIFAVDVDVRGKERFAGKPVINAPVKRGIDEPAKMVQEALAAADNPHARRVPHFGAEEQAEQEASRKGRAHRPEAEEGPAHRRQLHDPVCRRRRPADRPGLPAGRLSTSPGHASQRHRWQTTPCQPPDGAWPLYLGAVLFKIGALSMGFLVPALAGYIAYAIADRPGIAPGFVAGAVSGFMGAGFLGGIVGGLLAGYIAHVIGDAGQVPRWLRGLMPVVIIPLLASIVASGLMFLFLGGPIAASPRG